MNEQHDRSIVTAIRRMAGTFTAQNVTVTTGSVVSVDKDARSCVVLINDDVELTAILMAQIGDGFLCIPAIDSTVMVMYATYTDAYVIMCSDLDLISLKGEELGGLVKVIELTDRLNTIEKDINALKSAFGSWVVVPGDGGLALKTASASWTGSNLTETDRLDIENVNVTHGN